MSTTIDTLQSKQSEIAAACKASDVKRLELFGSRATGASVTESDADFLVEFNDPLRAGVFDRYLALCESLRHIMGCSIDLVELSSIQDPILRKRIEQEKRLVYAE